VERGITLAAAATSGTLVVLFAAAAAERPQRRTAAVGAMVLGTVAAIIMVAVSGPAESDFLPEAMVTIGCAIWALYRVHRQLDSRGLKARYQARYQARYLARRKAQKEEQRELRAGSRKKKSGRRRRQTARRGVPRPEAPSRRHRRRLQPSLDPGSPSSMMGKAAMAAFMLLGLWTIFMTIIFVTHHTESLETETLSRFEEMFAWWMLAAFLTILFLVVEMAGRAATSTRRNFRRLATDLFALIMVTLMMAINMQFSNLYSIKYWERHYAHVPSHTIGGDFSYPSILAPGSTANKEWLEFQEWLDHSMYRTKVVRLDFLPEQSVRHLAQCTPDIWRAQCLEIRFRVGDGPEHLLRSPWAKWYYDVLLPLEDGSLDALVLLPFLTAGPFRDQVAPEEDVRSISLERPLELEQLDQMIQDTDRYSPLQLLVPRDASIQWLDSLLRRLEERGAKSFILIFYG